MEKIPNYIPVLVFDANHVFVEEMRDVSFALIHCRNFLPGLHVEQEITEGIKELTSLMVGYWFSILPEGFPLLLALAQDRFLSPFNYQTFLSMTEAETSLSWLPFCS